MSMRTRKHVGEYGMGVSILRATLYSAEVREHLGVLFLFILFSFSLFRSRPSWALLGALLGSSWGPFGGPLGSSWGPLGALWGPSWSLLGGLGVGPGGVLWAFRGILKLS